MITFIRMVWRCKPTLALCWAVLLAGWHSHHWIAGMLTCGLALWVAWDRFATEVLLYGLICEARKQARTIEQQNDAILKARKAIEYQQDVLRQERR